MGGGFIVFLVFGKWGLPFIFYNAFRPHTRLRRISSYAFFAVFGAALVFLLKMGILLIRTNISPIAPHYASFCVALSE